MADNDEPRVDLRIEPYREEGNVAWLAFDQTRRLNVLGTPMLVKTIETLESLGEREDIRAVVLTGAGERAFIGGADIREFAAFDEPLAVEFIARIHRVCELIRHLPFPSIARIRGFCLGAGMEVAAACDMRAADTTSKFGMPEVRVGVPSVIEAALLPGLIGWGKTRELLLTGEMIDAEEAERCRFLEALTPPKKLDRKVESWLDSILASGPRAIQLQKSLIREWEELPIRDAILRGVTVFGETYRSDEPRRYARQFLDRKRG